MGPGNCLIDEWLRKNSKEKFDENGKIANRGKVNDLILNQALDNFENNLNKNISSFDIRDFDLGFVRGLNLEDGLATLTEFTGRVIGNELINFLSKINNETWNILICGGGRKNLTLIKSIVNNTNKKIKIQPIDNFNIDGDFVESQAFAYLAIRSSLGLPISFPGTTSCNEPTTGGVIVRSI